MLIATPPNSSGLAISLCPRLELMVRCSPSDYDPVYNMFLLPAGMCSSSGLCEAPLKATQTQVGHKLTADTHGYVMVACGMRNFDELM